MLLSTASIVCLATNIYFEARGEDRIGQYAVAEVTLNRVASPDYPDDVCSVVKQAYVDAHGNPLRHKCQFSWYCDGKSDKPKDKRAWTRAVQIASATLIDFEAEERRVVGHKVHHYHNKKVKPRWAKAMRAVARIGNHIFYEAKNG